MPVNRIIFFFVTCILAASGFSRPLAFAAVTAEIDNNPNEALNLDRQTQKRAGLKTIVLASVRYQPEDTAYGRAISIQPLLDLRNRYFSAAAADASAKARLTLARQSNKRLNNLYRNDIISKRALQEQQSQLTTKRVQVQAQQFQMQSIHDEAVVNWGSQLAALFLSDNADSLAPILSGQKNIIQITLPADKTLSKDTRQILISPTGNKSQSGPAERLSKAPQTDDFMQGESYFFLTEHPGVRAGSRISAWIPVMQQTETGILIPKSALIWHLGQAFVYVKTGANRFNRRRISHFITANDGYFCRDTLAPGTEIVTTGAQLLLSEEFRSQIPEEDDHDDD